MALGNGRLSKQPDTSSVRTDTGQNQDNERPEPAEAESGYSSAERAAIDEANEAFAPVIQAVDTLENIESRVPPVVRGVRALRDRAMRETGALTHLDQQYRMRFGDLLNAEPIGPWLLDEHRRSILDAVHYLGGEDSYLDSFIEWLATKLTDKQRKKWRKLRTLVDHFKEWQHGTVRTKERRTPDQREIERVRTDGHKADTAREAEVEQTRRELATQAVESTETLWTVLDQAGPERFVESSQAERRQGLRASCLPAVGCLAQRADGMKIPVPEKDETGTVLRLAKFQEHSIRDVLRTLDQGAVIGTGTARGALLADIMGAGKTVVAIAGVNSVPRFRRILVICMASGVEKVWVEHIRRWQTRRLRITPVHAENTYDIGSIPSGWVIINYALLKKHHDGLRAKEWDMIIIDEGQALKTWNSVRTMNVFGGFVDDLDHERRSNWQYHGREIKPLAGNTTKVLILTGTPIKNWLDELFPLVNFLDPRSFPDIHDFVEQSHEADWRLDNNRRLTGTPSYR